MGKSNLLQKYIGLEPVCYLCIFVKLAAHPQNMKKSCFVVDEPYLPLYCLEQCPKVFLKSCQQYLSYVPMYVRNCGVSIVGGTTLGAGAH